MSGAMSALLRLAARTGSAAAVRARLAAGDAADAPDSDGMTALMVAAARGHREVVVALIEGGADPGAVAPGGSDAALLAGAAGHAGLAAFIRSRCPCADGPSTARLHRAGDDPVMASMDAGRAGTAPDGSIQLAGRELGDDGWEVEEEPSLPVDDTRLKEHAKAVQSLMDRHAIVDHDLDWGDVEVDLPVPVAPEKRRLDEPQMDLLARIAQAALGAGCVARDDLLEALSGRSTDQCEHEKRLGALLLLALEDSGVLVEDEPLAQSCAGLRDLLEPVGDRPADDAEELARWVADLAAGQDDPFWHWTRALQPGKPLLTHEEEIRLGKQMRQALEEGLATLISTPAGRRALLSFAGAPSTDDSGEQAGDDEDLSDDAAVENETDLDERPDETGQAPQIDIEARLATLVEGYREPDAELLAGMAAWLRRSRAGIASLAALADLLRSEEPDNPTLPRLDEQWLRVRTARDELVNRNLRLVLAVGRRMPAQGMSLTDILQDGTMGLMRAATGYEPDRGFRFSTYATWWVKQAIFRGIQDKSRLIRIPVHVGEKVRMLERAERDLALQLGRQPSLDELSRVAGLPERTVRRVAAAKDQVLWIDDPENAGWVQRVDPASERIADPEAECDRAMVVRRVRQELDALQPKVAQIIRMRYGIGTGHERTLEETGTAFEITRERIRQIESKALKSLPKRLDDLSPSPSGPRRAIGAASTPAEAGRAPVRPAVEPPPPISLATSLGQAEPAPDASSPPDERDEHPESRKLRIVLRLLASPRRQRNVASWTDSPAPQKELATRWFQAYSTVDPDGLYSARQHGCFQALSSALRTALRITGFGPTGIDDLLLQPVWQQVLVAARTALQAMHDEEGALNAGLQELVG